MKKILFLIMLAVVPASAFAEYNFYTYGNGAMLYSTLNAVAMIFNDSGFISLTRLVFTLAFLASFYMTAFLKRWDVLKYAIISFFILGLFLYSKDRVVIHDVIQDELYVVDNIPKAFGFLGEYVSSPGHFTTEKFDTGFAVPITTLLFGKSNAMPLNLTYSKSGFAGPFKMIKDLGSFELPDQQIQADFYEYVKKCAKWDVMGLNSSEMKIFKENLNLSSTDVIPDGLSSRFYVPVTIGGVKSQCATYYVANLYPRIVASIGGSEAILSSEPKLLNYMSGLSSSMAFFTGESLTTYNAMTQSAVVKTAIRSLSGSLANGREEYNQFMAELGIAKFEQQGEVISRVAMKLIPIFRNVMEILMIATLPIVFLLFLLPNGYKLIWEYILSLIWLQLWNPILAVMQMVMNLSAVMEASAAGKVTEIGGFTIHSFGYWGDFSNSYLAVAGYMMISVPMLAHLVLRGGKFMGAQLGQGLASAAMGAGAMSVDPNAVKGAGYLTAEEKALNESGIEKMFMIQNMHNAGAARNIDSGRAYEKRAEASAEMGIDPMSGYAGFKADAQTQNELAGMTSAASLAGRYGGNVEAGRAKGEGDYMNQASSNDRNRMLSEHYGSPEAAINEMAGAGFKSQVENNSAFSPMSARDAEKAGLLKGAGKLGGIDAMGRTTGQDITTPEGFEAARQQNEDMKSTFTYADENGAVHKVGVGKDGKVGLDQKTSGDQETVYKGAYKEDGSWERNHNQVDTAKNEKNRDNIDTAKRLVDQSDVENKSVVRDTSQRTITGTENKDLTSGINTVAADKTEFGKPIYGVMQTEEGRKQMAEQVLMAARYGEGAFKQLATEASGNLGETLSSFGSETMNKVHGDGWQAKAEAGVGMNLKLARFGGSVSKDHHEKTDYQTVINDVNNDIYDQMMKSYNQKKEIGGDFTIEDAERIVNNLFNSSEAYLDNFISIRQEETGNQENTAELKEKFENNAQAGEYGNNETDARSKAYQGGYGTPTQSTPQYKQTSQSTPVAPERVETPQRVDVAQVTSQTQVEAPRTDAPQSTPVAGDPTSSSGKEFKDV